MKEKIQPYGKMVKKSLDRTDSDFGREKDETPSHLLNGLTEDTFSTQEKRVNH